ncbi:heme ABC transporter ATP-binding protein [Roseovarius sp. M141]|uniref:heme ABC transporter ATP-binding protein n=1 Tax=Roseovarius sp. M141 TaxID=2583806 RepID=UPI0020CD2858|nr:heme ABC transporter ATP-binding protein [Roseovarius sp. M141]
MSVHGQNIRLSLGGTPILHGIDFVAQPGHVTAIVGPNGSGKSTLLRVLSGEERADGSATINGLPIVGNARQLARMRGVLPQGASMAFPFTVAEVLRIGLSAGPYAAEATIPAQALAAVGLTGAGHRYYHELSGGQQQRAQLARVLCQVWQPVLGGTPSWLLLDEPVASLDIGHQLIIMDLARRYAQAGGGVIAVMHDLNLTALYADRVTLIEAGRVAATGTPAQVLTDAILSKAYGCRLSVNTAPQLGTPYILPHSAQVL